MLDHANVGRPRLLADEQARRLRLQRVMEPHVQPLNCWVRRVRDQDSNKEIPYFDPCDGGVDAEILFLLEAPGPQAVNTGFVSRDNPDQTAENFFLLSMDAGIDRKTTVIWNVVPWYVGDGRRIRPVGAADIKAAQLPLRELFEHLPRLKLVVFVGRKAERVRVFVEVLMPELRMATCPHPSPMFVNRNPANRGRVAEALRTVAEIYAGL